jgi:hypothetical protein
VAAVNGDEDYTEGCCWECFPKPHSSRLCQQLLRHEHNEHEGSQHNNDNETTDIGGEG